MIKSFFNRIFGKANTQQIPLNNAAARAFLSQPYSMSGRFGWTNVQATMAWKYYKQIAQVRDAIDTGAKCFNTVPFAVEDLETGEIYLSPQRGILETEVLKLLRRPNQSQSGSKLKTDAYASYNVTGDFFLVANGLSLDRPPAELYKTMPQYVTVTTNNDGMVLNYKIDRGENKGTYRRTDTEDDRVVYVDDDDRQLWHMKTFQPDDCNSGMGLSPLSSLFYELEGSSAISINNNSMLRNGMRPGLVLSTGKQDKEVETNLTDEQIQSIRTSSMQMYSGPNNAGNVMLLEGIDKIVELAINNKDMQFKEMKEADILQIYRSLNIPLPLVNQDSQTYNNFAEAQLMFYYMTIIPFAHEYAEAMNEFLMPRYGDSERYKIIPYVKGIPAIKNNDDKEKDSIMTLNERRQGAGLDELEVDFVEVGNQIVPLGSIPEEISEDKFIDSLTLKGMTIEQAKAEYHKYCAHH